MHRPPKTSKLADWRTGYALLIGCRSCKHSRRTDPRSLARLLGWEVPLIVVAARLRCSNCHSKDCEIQVDRLMPLPKRALQAKRTRAAVASDTRIAATSAAPATEPTSAGADRCATTTQ